MISLRAYLGIFIAYFLLKKRINANLLFLKKMGCTVAAMFLFGILIKSNRSDVIKIYSIDTICQDTLESLKLHSRFPNGTQTFKLLASECSDPLLESQAFDRILREDASLGSEVLYYEPSSVARSIWLLHYSIRVVVVTSDRDQIQAITYLQQLHNMANNWQVFSQSSLRRSFRLILADSYTIDWVDTYKSLERFANPNAVSFIRFLDGPLPYDSVIPMFPHRNLKVLKSRGHAIGILLHL
jgi:hypothetical protein